MIIDGKKIAQEIIEHLKTQVVPKKILAAILVGENPASISFLKQKEKIANELNIDFRIYNFPETIKNDKLRQEVGRIVSQKPVAGVIVQLPLPKNINPHYALNAISREKDVDVLSERALGAFYSGRNPVLPPAAGVVEEIVNATGFKLHASRVAVVGLGFLVGKPIANWLMGNPSAKLRARCSEIYLLDEGSNLEILKQADLVISGVGKAGLIKPEMLREGSGIIDFGYSYEEESAKGKEKSVIRGDFDTFSLSALPFSLSFYTPTPGGTGPILVAKIFENFYTLAQKG